MADEFTHAMPGKAGLFFSCEELNEAGWLLEHEARSSLERWCQSCGQSACFGYGVSLKDEGVWSCADEDCQASAQASVARRDCLAPPAEQSITEPTLDLFGEAA